MNIKKKKIKKNIGLLGGSFDPPHKGHLTVSTTAKKRFKLDHIIWAITKKNPFKKKSKLSLNERIKLAKKIIKFNKFIKLNILKIKLNLIEQLI